MSLIPNLLNNNEVKNPGVRFGKRTQEEYNQIVILSPESQYLVQRTISLAMAT